MQYFSSSQDQCSLHQRPFKAKQPRGPRGHASGPVALNERSERSPNFWKKFRPLPQNSPQELLRSPRKHPSARVHNLNVAKAPLPAVATAKTTRGSEANALMSNESMVAHRTAWNSRRTSEFWQLNCLTSGEACRMFNSLAWTVDIENSRAKKERKKGVCCHLSVRILED